MWRNLVLLAAVFWAASLPAQSPEPVRPLIRVGVLTDNFPFSFQTGNDPPEGFVVELFAAIEEVMALSCERVIGPTETINPAFRSGTLDLLQSYAPSPAREQYADFSVPYVVMEGAVFTRRGFRTVRTLEDLRGARVLVHRGSLGEQLLRGAGLADSIVPVDSVEQAFRWIEDDRGDATLASRLTGNATIHHLGLRRVVMVDAPVEGYSVRYCFAVQAGDAELLARINEGLAILRSTGRFEEIYRKWFGRLEPTGFSALQVALAVAVGLAIALAVALVGMFRQRNLRRRIASQAETLRFREEYQRTLFDALPLGLLVVAPHSEAGEYRLQRANPAALRLFGWTESPAPGTPLRGAAPAFEAFWDALEPELASPEPGAFEQLVEAPDRPACWLRVLIARLGDERLVALDDVTEETLAAERLQQHERQLRQTQKLEALGTLSSGIAHDFNNILAGMLGYTELAMLDVDASTNVHSYLRRVIEAGDRARALVRQILTFSEPAESYCELLDLTALIDETLRFIRAATPSSIELRHDRPAEPLHVLGDATQIHQVLMNLCTNAVQAMQGRSGQLTLRGQPVDTESGISIPARAQLPPGRYICVTISDTGPGIPPEVLHRVFEPFFTTKPTGEGTGLGLSVVHGIMQGHGGAVTVESEIGRGATFHLYFPAAAATAISNPSSSGPDAERADINGVRVLLIDDEPLIATSLAEYLQRHGARVAVYTDPAAAIEKFTATSGAFDVVVTDMTMPHLSGLEVAETIHRLQPSLPVIITSGRMDEAGRRRSVSNGVSAILTKPVSGEILRRTIARQLVSPRQ